jgi:hypothetical protein
VSEFKMVQSIRKQKKDFEKKRNFLALGHFWPNYFPLPPSRSPTGPSLALFPVIFLTGATTCLSPWPSSISAGMHATAAVVP